MFTQPIDLIRTELNSYFPLHPTNLVLDYALDSAPITARELDTYVDCKVLEIVLNYLNPHEYTNDPNVLALFVNRDIRWKDCMGPACKKNKAFLQFTANISQRRFNSEVQHLALSQEVG